MAANRQHTIHWEQWTCDNVIKWSALLYESLAPRPRASAVDKESKQSSTSAQPHKFAQQIAVNNDMAPESSPKKREEIELKTKGDSIAAYLRRHCGYRTYSLKIKLENWKISSLFKGTFSCQIVNENRKLQVYKFQSIKSRKEKWLNSFKKKMLNVLL